MMPNVSLLEFQAGETLTTLYAPADVGIMPSSWENLPFTVLEGLASDLPLIASRTGGIPELIEDGKSGLLVDIRDMHTGQHRFDAGQILADAIGRLAVNQDERVPLGANARLRAEMTFSESRLGDDLMDVFRRTLQR